MAGEYDSSRDLAARLIIKKGRQITFRRRVTAEVADPKRPWDKEPPNERDFKVKAVLLDYEKRFINGTTILAGDKSCLIPATLLPFQPAKKDRIWDDKYRKWFSIENVEVLDPGPVDVLYTLQLRG